VNEILPAYGFQPRKFAERVGVIVDAQVKLRPFLFAMDEERSRLLAALVPSRRLARAHRADEPARKRQAVIRNVSRRRIFQDARTRQHVAGKREVATGTMPAPAHAGWPGMGGAMSGRIHHVDLTVIAARIICDEARNDLIDGRACAQQVQPIRAVQQVNQSLGSNGTHP